MASNIFDNIRASSSGTAKSVQWYQAQIRKLGSISKSKLFAEGGELTNIILPGEMYMFRYDPKTKESLPFYDTFPLVLPFRKLQDGFYGINLHYLPYGIRFKMLGLLSEYATDERKDQATRLRLSWRILESSSQLAPIKACVKHYLTDHVETRFLKIQYPDWITASQLPLESFQKADKARVWRETRKKY